MDAYVIKTKRENPSKVKKKEKKKSMKQVTIEALPRVVVVEDIERLNAILGNEDDYDAVENALTDLKCLRPSKEILLRTKIGHRISKLRRSKNAIIRSLACEVFADWRKFYKTQRQRETIEVRCDSKTELSRMKARKLLADSLHLTVTDTVPELIEREVFKNAKRKVNVVYKRNIRRLCFKIKDESTKRDLLNGKIQIVCFCKDIL